MLTRQPTLPSKCQASARSSLFTVWPTQASKVTSLSQHHCSRFYQPARLASQQSTSRQSRILFTSLSMHNEVCTHQPISWPARRASTPLHAYGNAHRLLQHNPACTHSSSSLPKLQCGHRSCTLPALIAYNCQAVDFGVQIYAVHTNFNSCGSS